MKEMKKQLTCYKNEIQGIKKMEQYLTLENYQKLINEFNQLYDHYKGLKAINKKMKVELKQSNQRENILEVAQKTKEFGDQAAKLEVEYDKLFAVDQNGNVTNSLDNISALIIDSQNREIEMIDKGGVKIPKLDLSSIYIQREVVSTQNGGDEETNSEEDYYQE